jgi:DNA-binding MarR family transcriptional regulator
MRVLSRRVNDALRPVGITSAQFCLLSFLYQGNPPTVKELADKIKIHRMHVSAQVSLLIRRNLVTSATPRATRSPRCLMLTPHGITVLMEALPLWQKADEDTRDMLNHVDVDFLSSLAAETEQDNEIQACDLQS